MYEARTAAGYWQPPPGEQLALCCPAHTHSALH